MEAENGPFTGAIFLGAPEGGPRRGRDPAMP